MLSHIQLSKNILQAPMAGVTTPSFVAACSEAGILGFIGAGYLDENDTRKFIQLVKKLTNKPFGINLYIQEEPKVDVKVLQNARIALQPIYDDLGIYEVPTIISKEVFNGQIEAVISEKVPIVSFTFGIPSKEVINKLKAAECYLIGTATTLEEALAVEKAGLDAIILQGSEAGGHRGYFIEPMQLIPIRDLIRLVKVHTKLPIIASGGIMKKEHIQEMYAIGATYVQMGTALLTANECDISQTYKNAILQSKEKDTCISSAYTGKPARGLQNTFTKQMENAIIAPYPLQFFLTSRILKISQQLGRKEYISLWMGENSYLAEAKSINKIVESF